MLSTTYRSLSMDVAFRRIVWCLSISTTHCVSNSSSAIIDSNKYQLNNVSEPQLHIFCNYLPVATAAAVTYLMVIHYQGLCTLWQIVSIELSLIHTYLNQE